MCGKSVAEATHRARPSTDDPGAPTARHQMFMADRAHRAHPAPAGSVLLCRVHESAIADGALLTDRQPRIGSHVFSVRRARAHTVTGLNSLRTGHTLRCPCG